MFTSTQIREPRRAARFGLLALLALAALVAALLAYPASSASAKQVDATFRLELDGEVVGVFTNASGMGSESEIIEHRVVDASGTEITLKIPGAVKYSDIVLERGLEASVELWQWRAQVEQGNLAEARRDGSIIMFDAAGTDVARWDFVDGWPSKVTVLSPDDSTVVMESLTIVVRELQRVS
jgi:phage tail-like protein